MSMHIKELGTATIGLAMSLVACASGNGTVDSGNDTTLTAETIKTDDKETDNQSVTKEEKDTDKVTDEQDGKDGEDGTRPDLHLSGLLSEPLENGYETGKHQATIEVEGYGTIQLELDADAAPITVSNFADLANQKFYDGLTFHRIMRNFMIQGGDPLGNGRGDSGRNIKGEFANNNVKNPIKHERGTISMARNGYDMDSASSQFFICDSDEDSFLDGDYAAFGRVTKGMDVVDAIAKDAKPIDNNGTIKPANQPVITSIRVGDGSLG